MSYHQVFTIMMKYVLTTLLSHYLFLMVIRSDNSKTTHNWRHWRWTYSTSGHPFLDEDTEGQI